MTASLNAFILGTRSPITAALTDTIITDGVSSGGAAQAFWSGFDGINALTVEADFAWVSGAAAAILRIDTAHGSGAPWRNVMRFDFAAAVLVREMTIIRGAVLTPVTLADLAAEGAINYLGDRFRARLTTTGTYSGGTLITVRATWSK
jgi:hypothetical protein